HETIRRLIGTLVHDVTVNSRRLLQDADPAHIDDVRCLKKAVIAFSPALREEATALKRFLHQHLYQHPRVHQVMTQARSVVRDLFGAFMEKPKLLPAEHARAARAARNDTARARVIADYVAGMTDRFALEEHERLSGPHRSR